MSLTRVLLTMVVVAAAGLAVYLYRDRQGESAARTARELVATQQFLDERGGNGQGAMLAETGSAPSQAVGAGSAPGDQVVAGTVEGVEGNTFTVESPDGTVVRVEVAEGATIEKDEDASLADIRPGDEVVALGSQTDDVFEASDLQIGGQSPVQGGAVVLQSAETSGSQVTLVPLSGTVVRVEGDQIIVSRQDNNEVTVRLFDQARVHRKGEIEASDLHPGDSILAFGSRDGNVFRATRVQVGSFQVAGPLQTP